MNSIILASICALASAGIVGITLWFYFKIKRDQAVNIALENAPKILPDLLPVLHLLRQPALVIGRHDEVLDTSGPTSAMGIAGGSRIIVPEILEMVRESRRLAATLTREVQIGRGATQGQMSVLVSVTQLSSTGMMLVLVEDLTLTRRINESRREFVANISHELKTPVGAITALSEAIQTAADDPQSVVHFAELMQRETARLGLLIGQIIDLSRLQADDPLLDPAPVDIDDVIGEALGRNRAVAESRSVNLITLLGGDCWVVGEHTQLSDAISNLVSNAINYSERGARVSVSSRKVLHSDGEFIEVAVSDNGIGIHPNDHERIFERFYRVDYARSRKSGGTGLGLSIVRHIAEAHGGKVSLWSRPGQGSTFTLTLPAALLTTESES